MIFCVTRSAESCLSTLFIIVASFCMDLLAVFLKKRRARPIYNLERD